jgi:polyhydroxybutyrate depolymerase
MMQRPALPAALVLAALPLSAAAPAAAGLAAGDYLDRSFVFDGVERSYDIHVPPSYDGTDPVPLVLDLHGLGGFKEQQAGLSGIRARSDVGGFVAVWPQGIQNSWNAGWCCGQAQDDGVADVAFLRTLVDAVAAELMIDRRRIYATGLSNGGAMTQRLACEAADLFAAAAPVAFPIGLSPITDCEPSRPIPVLTFQGLTDDVVPYEGGGPFASAADSFAHWRSINGCGPEPLEETVVSGASRCETDTSCTSGADTGLCSVLCTLEIPPFSGHLLYINDDFVLDELIWDFLSAFTLPGFAALPPVGVAGKALSIKDGADPAKRKLGLSVKDAALALGTSDPTVEGAQLQVYNTAGSGESVCLQLPAGGWKRKGAGFVYKDKQGTNGPCQSAKLAPGKLQVSCSGKRQPLGYSLDEASQGQVGARFESGGLFLCAGFGGSVVEDTGVAVGKARFLAKQAPAPILCPVPRAPCTLKQ